MRRFNDCTWLEASEAVLAMVSRLTVMKDTAGDEPMLCLTRCMRALLAGDIRIASDECFNMTSALLTCGARRVSGELFRDYLLHRLLIVPNAFSKMAAAGSIDEALYNAMRVDMGILYELMSLDAEELYRYVQDRFKELKVKGRPGLDDTTRLASAAWGGAVLRPKQEEQGILPALPAMLPDAAPVWHYGEEEMRGSYTADEALEEMYHRLLEGGVDWSGMTEDVWNFFSAYGTGEFLKNRMFAWSQGRLAPMTDLRLYPLRPLTEREYRLCLDHCIEFMRGNSTEPLFICGPAGMGKTTMLFCLADELPEMRFVYVPKCGSICELEGLFAELSRQPLKFMVALDDSGVYDFAVRAIPVNVLLTVATSSGEECGAGFTKCVTLERPNLEGFAAMVQSILEAEGVELNRDVIRAACVDRQVDTKGRLSAAAAVSVARALAAKHAGL